MWGFFASQKFPWKTRNLAWHFSASFTTSAKDLREIAEIISSQSISIFLIATEFNFKICVQLTSKKLTSKKQQTETFLSNFCLAQKSKTFPSLVNLNSYNFFNFLGSAS